MDEIQKVAVLLIALGPIHARRILDKLGPDEMLVIIDEMRKMSKVSVDDRMAILEEVNELLESLSSGAPTGATTDASHFAPPAPPNSAAAILDPVKDELPPKIDPDRISDRGIDWGGAGFDFGSRSDSDGDDPPQSPEDRGR
ncbi:MAG: hypothetical protein CME26_00840 [Gemmatimonadetes bacterium]|nr:hypothetical protein [Gemmatimonadota bacterium]|tara:strand:+ start:4732 stop:5157 length:426 start_codon:yes stop_codon:yes gene_type:complete